MAGSLSRREFLKTGVVAAAAALLPHSLFAADEGPKPVVAVARGARDKLAKAAIDGVGGIAKFVGAGDKVLLKPNMSFAANADCGATTSAGFVRQVVELCLAAGAAKVVIADHTIQDPALCVERSGMNAAVVDPAKVSIMTLNQERQFVEVPAGDGRQVASWKLARVLQQSDKFINLPTAKSHSATGVSLGLKNLMGLIWDRGVFHQLDLNACIAELATVVKPVLTVVDASRALTTGGPGGPGKTAVLDAAVAGGDIVAVDSTAVGLTQWYGRAFTGSGVRHIVAAAGLGLGEIDTAKHDRREVKAA